MKHSAVRSGNGALVAIVFIFFLAVGCTSQPSVRATSSPVILPPLPTPIQPHTGGADLAIAYVFDASVAMQAPFGDTTRLEAARRLLAEHLRTQPVDARLGLWAFGHRRHFTDRAASCADVEQVAPLLPGQGVRIADWLANVQAQGLAPLSQALEAVLLDLRAAPVSHKGVVLISSGMDSCGRNPCAEVQKLTAEGVEVVLYVIALGVDPLVVGQLRCIADAAGGKMYQVVSEDEMGQALEEVAAALVPASPPVRTRSVGTKPAREATLTVTDLPRTVTLAAPSPTRPPTTAASKPVAPTATPSITPSAAVAPPPPVETTPQPTATPHVETIHTVNVRAGPGLIYPVIGWIPAGTRLTALASYLNRAEGRFWLLICCLPDGRRGWVAAELVTEPPVPLPTPATVPPTPTPSPTLGATDTPSPTSLPPTLLPPTSPPVPPGPEPPGKPPVPTPVP